MESNGTKSGEAGDGQHGPSHGTGRAQGQQESLAGVVDAVGRNDEAIGNILDKIHGIVQDVGARRSSMSRLTSWLLFMFMVIIVIGSGFLVYAGRMGDGSFTFLLGVMIGALVQLMASFNLGGSGD